MAIETLQIYPDREEYSRFEPSRKVIKVRVVPTPSTGLNEQVKVALCRHDGAELASQTIAFLGDYPKGAFASFDTSEISDADGYPVCIRGNYSVIASVGNVITSKVVKISLITVDGMKESYCAGIPLNFRDMMTVKKQPSLVTGIRVDRISQGTPAGLHLLKYEKSTSTLQFNKGAKVEIGSGVTQEVLPDERSNYLEVTIDSFEIPDNDAAEMLLIDREALDDATIRSEIEKATTEVERIIGTFLEPIRMATEPFYRNPEQAEWFDKEATAGTFYRREVFPEVAKAWHINLPYTHVQKVYHLEGRFGNQKSMSIENGIYKINHKQGVMDVLPNNAQFAYIVNFFSQLDFWGVREYIADFWRYKALIGLVDLEAELLKAVGYIAAIPLLVIAGQAARGGLSSESISKDGVSRSTSVSQGLYGDTIREMQAWIDKNRAGLAQRYRGFNMTVL